MSVIRLAIPILLVLVTLELLAARALGRRVYDFADALADLGCAALSQTIGIAVTAATLGGYALVAEHLSVHRWLALPPWPAGVAGWAAAFLLIDLGQYLIHRLAHRVSILWACHVVHHSSQELNLAVALRNSSFQGFFNWVFFLPLAVLGVPWPMLALCYGLNVLYQFWLHTRLIGSLGPLERWLNTPSHHRVHHGRDDKYLDRNFGGVLIVWDRLFGTFQAEQEEPQYGTTLPLGSWNPIWANLDGFALIVATWRRAPDWRGRVRALFAPPETLLLSDAPRQQVARPAPAVMAYVGIHLGLAIAATLRVVLPHGPPALVRLEAAALVIAALGTLGGLLDGRTWARRGELLRVMVTAALVLTQSSSASVRQAAAALAAGSLAWLVWRRGGAAQRAPRRYRALGVRP